MKNKGRNTQKHFKMMYEEGRDMDGLYFLTTKIASGSRKSMVRKD